MELLARKKTASINLLEDEEAVKSSSQKKLTLTICIIILLFSALLSGGLFTYSFIQKTKLNNLKEEVNTKTTAWQVFEPVARSLKSITEKNQVVVSAHAKYAGLDKKLDKVRGLLPEGVSLSTLTVNNQGKTVISGQSSSAAVVYQFYEILKKDSEIKDPLLDSLAKSSTDYTFNISLSLITK